MFATGLAEVQRLRVGGRHAEAEVAVVRLLDDTRVRHGARGTELATAHNEFGLLLKAMGEYPRARAQYEIAHGLVRGAGDSDEAATIMHNIAGIRFVLGDVAGAARWGRRGLAMRRRLHGPDELVVLLDEGNLAPMLVALGRHAAAQRMLDRLLVLFTTTLGPDDAEVAVTLTNLGALAAQREDWAAARAHLARAAEIKAVRFGPDSPELVSTLANLAVVTERAGAAKAAREVHARACRIARAALSATHPLRQHVEKLWPPPQ